MPLTSRSSGALAADGSLDLADAPTRLDAPEDDARAEVERLAPRIRTAHQWLMAHERRGLLVVLQGMDASGKDEAIRDVLSAADPRGIVQEPFKRATGEALRHGILWRAARLAPARGELGVFNRSYYEHVVAERVHPEALDEQGLPDERRATVWDDRYRQIRDFERYLEESGVAVLKLFLHVSPEVQKERLLARIDDPDARWEFSEADVRERAHWDAYMDAYASALEATSTERAPWRLVPADGPWAARAVVAREVVGALEALHGGFPDADDPEMLDRAREALLGER